MIPALLGSSSAIAVAAGGITITLAGGGVFKLALEPVDAWAGWRIERDGDVGRLRSTSGSPYSDVANWADPVTADVGDAYEVRLTVNSGISPSGQAVNSWLALTSDRSWYLVQTFEGSKSNNCTIQIRDAATQTVQDSGTYTMSVTVSF